jgi:hypothetical protein
VLHRSVAGRRQVRSSALSDWAHHNDVLCSRSVRAGHDRRTRSGASEAIDDRRHGLVVEHGEVAVVAAAAVLVLVAEVLALTRGDEAGGPDETVLAATPASKPLRSGSSSMTGATSCRSMAIRSGWS